MISTEGIMELVLFMALSTIVLMIIRISNDSGIINGLRQEKKSLRRFRGLFIGQKVFVIKHSKITYGKITWISLYKNHTSGAIEEKVEIDHSEELVNVEHICLTEEEAIHKLRSI